MSEEGLMSMSNVRNIILAFQLLSVWSICIIDNAIAQDNSELLAAKVEIRAVIEKISKFSVSRDSLEERMLGSPSEHKSKDDSNKKLKEWQRKKLNEQLKGDLAEISDRRLVTKEWIEEECNTQFEDMIEAAFDTALGSKFNDTFTDARNSAVKTQWQTVITEKVYPTEDEIDEIKSPEEIPLGVQNRIKADMVRKGAILFKENEESIADEIKKKIKDALKQRKEQEDHIRTIDVGDALSDLTIAESLTNKLNAYIDTKGVENPGKKIYAIFPSVAETISTSAVEKMKERFLEYIEDKNNKICSSIDSQTIENIIRGSPSEHFYPETSKVILIDSLSSVVRESLTTEYSDRDRGDSTFKSKLLNILEEDQKIAGAFDNKMTEELEGSISEVRKELIRGQLAVFSEVVSREYEFPEPQIIEFKEPPRGIVTINELGDSLNIANIDSVENSLVKESKDTLESSIRDLLGEGSRAIDAQVSLANELEKQIQDIFRTKLHNRRIDASKLHKEHKEEAFQLYLKQVKQIWEITSIRVQSIWPNQDTGTYRDDKYQELFDHTKEQIERIITPGFFEKAIQLGPKGPIEPEQPGDTGKIKIDSTQGSTNKTEKPERIENHKKKATPLWFWLLLLFLFILIVVALIVWIWSLRKRKRPESVTEKIEGKTTGQIDKIEERIPREVKKTKGYLSILVLLLAILALLIALLGLLGRGLGGGSGDGEKGMGRVLRGILGEGCHDRLFFFLLLILAIVLLLWLFKRRGRVTEISIYQRKRRVIGKYSFSKTIYDPVEVEKELTKCYEFVRKHIQALKKRADS